MDLDRVSEVSKAHIGTYQEDFDTIYSLRGLFEDNGLG